jgi:glutaredoxin
MFPTVTLYTRPGCHLCDDVRDLLQQLAARYPYRVVEVNIDEDAGLHARYHLTIPVIRVGSVELEAPIDPQALAAALRTTGRS